MHKSLVFTVIQAMKPTWRMGLTAFMGLMGFISILVFRGGTNTTQKINKPKYEVM